MRPSRISFGRTGAHRAVTAADRPEKEPRCCRDGFGAGAGRMMRTGYSGAKGNCPRYVCAHAKQLYGSARTCQSLGGRLLEQGVLDEIFKQLVRALIHEVVVTVNHEARTADVTIAWEGGATTSFQMALRKTGGHFRATDEDTLDLVGRLAVHYDDKTIAAIMSRQKRTTGTGLPFTQSRIKTLRQRYGIPAFVPPVAPPDGDAIVMTADQVANEFGVDKSTVYRWLKDGFIVGEQITSGAPWQIRVDDELRAKIAEDAPEGWFPLADAAIALGVARQTVLHRVQRGELKAGYV